MLRIMSANSLHSLDFASRQLIHPAQPPFLRGEQEFLLYFGLGRREEDPPQPPLVRREQEEEVIKVPLSKGENLSEKAESDAVKVPLTKGGRRGVFTSQHWRSTFPVNGISAKKPLSHHP